MNFEKLVDDYIDAWNRQDVAGLLELMHDGAAVYDAFWRETCVGKDLPQYLQDGFDEENHWYCRIGELMSIPDGVVYRYSAHERTESEIGPEVYTGAEVLVILSNKILTVSDYYCNPDRSSLIEIGELAAQRHGEPNHTKYGLGALKVMRYKANLSALMTEEKIYLDPNLTMSQVADRIGCSIEQLSYVVSRQFGPDSDIFLDSFRIQHAKPLLRQEPEDSIDLSDVAARVGFKSSDELERAFKRILGVTPEAYIRQNRNNPGSNGLLN